MWYRDTEDGLAALGHGCLGVKKLSIGRGNLHRHAQRGFNPFLDGDSGFERDVASVMVLAKVHVLYACYRIALKPYLFPDADGGKLRAPVPTKLAGRLAQVRPACYRLRHA